MSQPTSNCPNCGAPVTFRWSSAVQTACPFCKSIIVRVDLVLTNVGVVADLPPDPSPIQLLTEGTYQNRKFQVTGRLVYEYEQGGWNEWHVVFSDGSSGWLSDAQLQYAMSFHVPHGIALPTPAEISRGKRITHNNVEMEVATITRAKYKGFEGELPYPYYAIDQTVFADLRTSGSVFATIDYSDNPPLFFLGEWVDFDALQLKGLRQFEGWV
jgi:hypothetical protein